MKLTDLQNKYREFYEYVNCAHSILQELTINTDKYLSFYNSLKNHNKKISFEIEENLLFFQYFLMNMDNIIDCIDNIYLLQTELPSVKTKKRRIKKQKYTDEYEEDICVDLDYPSDINYREIL